jgi:hypothetical protein
MKKILDLRFAWVVSLIGFIQPALGQSGGNTPANGDRDIVSSIATYSTDLRSAVLDVAQYPQVLVKLERIQARSSQSFQDLISPYPREEQAKFYELSRFPDRLSLLVRDGKKSTEEAKHTLEDLPKETQASILDVYNNHFNDLAKIHSIYQASEEASQKAISDYPQEAQRDFQKVISRPEVMNLLTENIDLTTSLGEDYRANPNAVIGQLDSLNQQQRKDFADYKKEVENNPGLQKEMQSAADRFSSSYSQSDSPVDAYLNNQPDNYSNSAPVINNYYSYNPYPYWFSYPYWYATPIWYPVPYYYNTGFYYGRGGRIVIWGFPSFAYSNWFFNFGYRHYPHYYSRYNVYYHRNYASGGRGGGYRGYQSTRNDYGSRRNYNDQNRDRNNGNGSWTSGNRNQDMMNNRRNSVNRNQTPGNYNWNSINRNQTMGNSNRTPVGMNRNTSVNQNWIRSNSDGNRASVPLRQNDFRFSNSNRSTPQFNPGSSNSFGRQSSGGGGSRMGLSGGGGGGGSRGGGGGGHRGR